MSALDKVKQKLREALGRDLGEAFMAFQKELGPTSHIDDFILQSGRYAQIDKDFRRGLLTLSDRNVEFVKIQTVLSDIIEQLTESDLAPPVSDPELALKMGLPIASPQFLDPVFERLSIDWNRINHLHLVNCDRIGENQAFLNLRRKRLQKRQEFQFFFINACPSQRPGSFAERAILELLEKYETEEGGAILVRRKDKSPRLSIEDLPYEPTSMAASKRLLVKYFRDRFAYFEGPDEPPEAVLKACSQKIREGKKYIAFIFNINSENWDTYLTDYLRWLMDTLSANGPTNECQAEFLFFFSVPILHLHEKPPGVLRKAVEEIVKLFQSARPPQQDSLVPYDMIMRWDDPEITQPPVSGIKLPFGLHLKQLFKFGAENAPVQGYPFALRPITREEVYIWFAALGEADTVKVDELLVFTHLRDKAPLSRLPRYMDQGIIDMNDMEALQQDLYQFAMKKMKN